MSQQKSYSWKMLQQEIDSILERINADPALAVAAAVNPLFALEELGYELDQQAKQETEDRLRFEPKGAVRLRQLRKAIFELVGRDFNLNSPNELSDVLFKELNIPIPKQAKKGSRLKKKEKVIDTSPLPHRFSGQPDVKDPLEVLSNAHPVIEPLLEYRSLEASRPRLASRDIYEDVRRGQRRLFVQNLRGRLKTQPN